MLPCLMPHASFPVKAEYANWQSGHDENVAIFAGSTPASVTTIPWSNGEDACVTCRRVLVRFRPGSLSQGNHKSGRHAVGATDPCKVGVMGSTPMRSTETNGLMVQRDDTALAWRKSGFDSRSVHW